MGLRRAVSGLGLLVLLLVGVACGSSAPAPPPAAAPTTSEAPPSPPPPPPVLWPLTGQESSRPIDRPAVAVKIENSPEARPQSGLAQADVVWEQVVEGGISRFVAVYHSVLPAEIGPVRSVRPMDAPIAAPLQGLFAFSGGQPDFVAAIRAAGLQVISNDEGAPGFYRVSSRAAPHNVYADVRAFVAQADRRHRAAPPEQFAFATGEQRPTAVEAGEPARTLDLALSGLSRPRWTWHRPDGTWLRWEGGTPAVGAGGTQFRATNVVVLRVDVVLTPYTDPAGNPVPETRVVGSGRALVATGGRVIDARWSKPRPKAPVRLTGPGGAPVRLAPGNTWVELVPTTTGSVTATP